MSGAKVVTFYLITKAYYLKNTLTAYAVKNPQLFGIGDDCQTKPDVFAEAGID